MWVKICGNTNLDDALFAAESGADAVGFVFAPSRRQVSVEQVAAITRELPVRLEKVGVFASRDAEAIAQAARNAGLTGVQLHGGLDVPLLQELAVRLEGRVRIMQTLHWEVGDDLSPSRLADQVQEIAALGVTDRLLVDSKVGKASGGTGVSFDWSAARAVFAQLPEKVCLIVAGGLRPHNVASAIAHLQPWGVDVSSGVEASPGRKDRESVRAFIENARAASG